MESLYGSIIQNSKKRDPSLFLRKLKLYSKSTNFIQISNDSKIQDFKIATFFKYAKTSDPFFISLQIDNRQVLEIDINLYNRIR